MPQRALLCRRSDRCVDGIARASGTSVLPPSTLPVPKDQTHNCCTETTCESDDGGLRRRLQAYDKAHQARGPSEAGSQQRHPAKGLRPRSRLHEGQHAGHLPDEPPLSRSYLVIAGPSSSNGILRPGPRDGHVSEPRQQQQRAS